MGVRVRLDKDGVWYARPYVGLDARGRQIRPYKRFPKAGSEAEAQAMAEMWYEGLTCHGTVASARVGELLDEYVGMRERGGISPNTARQWRLFAGYAREYLRNANVRDLTVMDLQRLETRLLTPKDEGGRGLSRNTVGNVHTFLRVAFGGFVELGIIPSNPMLDVRKPAADPAASVSLDAYDYPELDSMLDLMWRDAPGSGRSEAACAFAAWLDLRCGLRVGEMCALRRRDVALLPIGSEHVHVCGNVIEATGRKPYRRPVTKGRRFRNVPLSDAAVEGIRAFTAMQDAWGLGLTGDSPLITADGSLMRPGTVSTRLTAVRKSLGMRGEVTFHTLRHTFATWVLVNGAADIVQLSEWLGHSSPAITLNRYGHVLPGNGKGAAERLQAAYDRAKGV